MAEVMRYNLYEFDGYRLIELLQKSENHTIDFGTRERRALLNVIKIVDAHNDNAMFDQVRRALEELTHSGTIPKNGEWNENSLKEHLIYLDLSNVFPLEKFCRKKYRIKRRKNCSSDQLAQSEMIVKQFFLNGFQLQTDEDGTVISYLPFEKSASMARECSMLFIDARLYQSVENRIHLGLDFEDTADIQPSKLYAYTGLLLSDARRIRKTPELVFNEETVIVLPDNVRSKMPIEKGAITGYDPAMTDGGQKWNIGYKDEFAADMNLFDGEGLISPHYSALINEALQAQYGTKGTASSFQIRMPFSKGMLHTVDFHAFICEFLGIASCENVFITDAYEKKRDLSKAQIILTQSMFKCFHWLKDEKITGLPGNTGDPMTLYFERFLRYGHGLYVANTDMNLTYSGKIKLNYQFLNTLALTDEEFDGIIDDQIFYARNKTDTIFSQSGPEEPYNEEEIGFEENSIAEGNLEKGEKWFQAANRNNAFLQDPKVQGKLKGVEYSLLKDIGLGKLIVGGGIKYLSRDLCPLLSFMIGKILPDGERISRESIEKAREELKKRRLRRNKFFTADCVPGNPIFRGGENRLKFDSRSYYGFLRNPHLSRNEQCSLRAFIPGKEDIYTRYFGHLKGIMMLPYFSEAAQALGGADFDGDLVKVFTDVRINRAINEACYEPDADGAETQPHRRKLPVVVIPDTIPRKIRLKKGSVDFATLKDTFSSRVGELSNFAISIGKREYDEEQRFQLPEGLNCETCTILVGLEIDAAKTGKHPYMKDYLKGRQPDYYIERIKQIKSLPKWYALKVVEIQESGNAETPFTQHRLSVVPENGPGRGNEQLNAVFTHEYPQREYFRIDRLPFRFLEELKKEPPGKDTCEVRGVRFAFEEEKGWRKRVSDKSKISQTEELIRAYKRIHVLSKEVYRTKERLKKTNYVGCIFTIHNLQYCGLLGNDEIVSLQERISKELLGCLNSYEKVKRAVHTLVEEYEWPYLKTSDEKDRYLQRLLSDGGEMILSDEVKDALENFSWNGYFLLYYYMKDIALIHQEAAVETRMAENEERLLPGKESSFYKDVRKIYMDALMAKEAKKIWKNRLIGYSKRKIREIFKGNLTESVMYVHYLRKIDDYGTFFWDVFTADEILEVSEGMNHAERAT